ncbi:MAG: hypothetical protein GY833_16500 [Aestuariibacter sp.]|nr:hypothetical protein [Aestuariibacter sp.]
MTDQLDLTRFTPPDYGDPRREFGEDYHAFTLCDGCLHMCRTEVIGVLKFEDYVMTVCPDCYRKMGEGE